MTGWIIFGSIVLVLALILIQSAKVVFVYDKNPGLPMLEVKIAFITLFRYPAPPKAKKAKKPKRQKASKKALKTDNGDKTANDSDTENEDNDEDDPFFAKQDEPDNKKQKQKKEKRSGKISFDLEMIMDYVRSAAPPIKRLFRKIKVRDLYIDWVTASDDAAVTALKYGAVCSTVYSTTKFLTTYFDVKPKEINIEADFSSEKDDIFVYCVVKLRLGTALACAIWLLARVIRTYLKYSKTTGKTTGKAACPKKQKA